jgi:16S rRNA processing protein RimM
VSSSQDRRVRVGRISGLFGVKGWVKLYSYTEPRDGLLEYDPLLLGENEDWRPVRLAEARLHGKGLIGLFEGIGDRDQAAALVGLELTVLRSQLPDMGPGEVYWVDLIGLSVDNVDGERLGTVERLLETGANDVLVVSGDRERLIPFVRDEVVKEIDLAAGRIVVDWGLDY